jgi:hypothetical protein
MAIPTHVHSSRRFQYPLSPPQNLGSVRFAQKRRGGVIVTQRRPHSFRCPQHCRSRKRGGISFKVFAIRMPPVPMPPRFRATLADGLCLQPTGTKNEGRLCRNEPTHINRLNSSSGLPRYRVETGWRSRYTFSFNSRTSDSFAVGVQLVERSR